MELIELLSECMSYDRHSPVLSDSCAKTGPYGCLNSEKLSWMKTTVKKAKPRVPRKMNPT